MSADRRVRNAHWKMVRLAEIAKATGTTARKETGPPVYSVTKHNGFVPSLEYFKKQVFSRDLSGYTIVEPGELAYATIHLDEGSIGVCPERCLISPMYTAFKVAETDALPVYVARYLKSPQALRHYPSLGKGSAERRKAISFERLGTLKIPLPSLAEQRRIAEILERAEALRTKRRAALAQLDFLTQSLFLDLFGDPVVNPKGLTKVKLGLVGVLDRGISKHRPRNDPQLLGGCYPLIQTGEVANCGGYITHFANTYSEFGFKQSKLWPAGTLCITIAANIAKTGILTFPACFPDSVVGFSAEDGATVEFVRVWLSFLQKTLEDTAPESAQKNINLAILRDLDVPLPPLKQQREFARRVTAVEKLKASQRASLAELDALFTALQYHAFRGEIKL